MNIVVTTDEGELIACVPVVDGGKAIMRNGYKAFQDETPQFRDNIATDGVRMAKFYVSQFVNEIKIMADEGKES